MSTSTAISSAEFIRCRPPLRRYGGESGNPRRRRTARKRWNPTFRSPSP